MAARNLPYRCAGFHGGTDFLGPWRALTCRSAVRRANQKSALRHWGPTTESNSVADKGGSNVQADAEYDRGGRTNHPLTNADPLAKQGVGQEGGHGPGVLIDKYYDRMIAFFKNEVMIVRK